MGNGIDYGRGLVNVDVKTGIRFGVILMYAVCQAWADEAEAVYPKPEYACPECGCKKLVWTDSEQSELLCHDCGFEWAPAMDEDSEPIGWKLDDGEYWAHQSQDDSDIFITRSPYYTLCEFCSPCAPGAGYIMNPGNTKAYCFGHDWFEVGIAPYPVFSVKTGERICSEPLKEISVTETDIAVLSEEKFFSGKWVIVREDDPRFDDLRRDRFTNVRPVEDMARYERATRFDNDGPIY